MFTENEIAHLKSQHLAHIATVDLSGQPDVPPVGFECDGKDFYIGGYDVTTTRKYKNIEAGQHKIALVMDDMESITPWQPGGIRIYRPAAISVWRQQICTSHVRKMEQCEIRKHLIS